MSGWPGYTGAQLLWAMRVERRAKELVALGLPRWATPKDVAAFELRREDAAERESRHLADIRNNGT